ncbi:MAG: hypothetical protein EB141_17115 [Verrucomicrobia bacterium]|nr:hypothetical protein [Verrucomicrobiota bacterium]NDB77332.1 hypothetical protein [Verrucomicrobiota bacterium]NDD39913.1 hypothetical protein [Verrucomicrobiota bacterium]NDE99974.1 hypothetical protein [Verrucomicrobiota bacterium]
MTSECLLPIVCPENMAADLHSGEVLSERLKGLVQQTTPNNPLTWHQLLASTGGRGLFPMVILKAVCLRLYQFLFAGLLG